MKKVFNIMNFFGALIVSLMLVSAVPYPANFISNNNANVAVVYGSSSADSVAADSVVNSLASLITVDDLDRILSSGITEDEIELGSLVGYEITSDLTDNKIPSLFDGKIEWEYDNDVDEYDVHEEILIGDIEIKTTLDDNDLDGVALINDKDLEYQLIFDEDIFSDSKELSDGDAEPLYIDMLGETYCIEDADSDSITVTKADKYYISEGASTIIGGKTFIIDSVYENAISINGVIINDGQKKKVDDTIIKVDEIYYTSKDTGVSKVDIYAGEDISEEYSDGEAFIGEDEDDPEWVWSIDNPGYEDGYIGVKYDLSQKDEDDDLVYEGDKYVFPNDFAVVSFDSLTDVEYYDYDISFDDVRVYERGDDNENGDSSYDVYALIVEGTEDDSFVLILDDSTEVETSTIYLQNTENGYLQLYYLDINEDYSTGKPVRAKNILLEEDNFDTLVLTNKYYDSNWSTSGTEAITIRYSVSGDEFEYSVVSGTVPDGYELVYAMDKENRFSDYATVKTLDEIDESLPMSGDWNADADPNYCDYNNSNDDYDTCVGAKLWIVNSDDINNDGTLTWENMESYYYETDLISYTKTSSSRYNLAELIADDTEMTVSISSDGSSLFIISDEGSSNIEVSLGGDSNYLYLGETEEDAESSDVKVDGKSVGTWDNDVVDYYGTIVESPEGNADDDKVSIRVPSEHVYAQVSILGTEEDSSNSTTGNTPSELGINKITDASIASASGKNVIVVGGSCINTVAASLLGGKFCGADFTSNTGVNAGQVLIKTFDRGDGSVATLVAGYNAEDTSRGVQYLLNNNVNIAVGESIII